MNLEELGWFLPVLDRKADRRVLFLPSRPTERSFSLSFERVERNSFKGLSSGYRSDMTPKVSSSILGPPESRRGQLILFLFR